MAAKKWGESFLKSGLPLEHVTLLKLTNMGWQCEPKYEYRRANRLGELCWFEVDMVAYAPAMRLGDLRFLIECKYHDPSRFWFFLPCSTEDHQAQYGALSAGGDLEADSKAAHHSPYNPLVKGDEHNLLNLAPRSLWGVTISRSGQREDNSVQSALDQLAYAFVPFCLERSYSFCSYVPQATIPVVVTSAKLFRLKPEVTDLEVVRNAGSPVEVADDLEWTWCYYAPRGDLLDYNMDRIDSLRAEYSAVIDAEVEAQLTDLWTCPRWFMVVNVGAVTKALSAVHACFATLDKAPAKLELLRELVEKVAEERRERYARREEDV